jgi:hypothetical protein
MDFNVFDIVEEFVLHANETTTSLLVDRGTAAKGDENALG